MSEGKYTAGFSRFLFKILIIKSTETPDLPTQIHFYTSSYVQMPEFRRFLSIFLTNLII